jgi:glycyl-tRNA synthetase beta chain
VKIKETTDFLFELGCEEIPAGMLPGAMKELKVILDKYLGAHNLISGAQIEVYGSPRRLAASFKPPQPAALQPQAVVGGDRDHDLEQLLHS